MNASRAIKTVSHLWIGTVAAAGCQFLVQWLLARKLGPTSFGSFAAAFALVTTISPLAGFGVHRFLLKVFGEEGVGATRWLPSAISFTMVTSCAVAVFLLGLAWLAFDPSASRPLLLILVPVIFGQITFELISSKFQLEESFVALSLWQLLPPVFRLTVVSALAMALGAGFSATDAALGYSFVAVGVSLLGAIQLRQVRKGRLSLAGHELSGSYPVARCEPSFVSVAKQSWPFGMDALFFLMYLQSGVIILEHASGAWSAGIYNVALTIVMAAYLLPGVVYQKYLLAKLHRWVRHDLNQVRRVHRLGRAVMLAFGIAALLFLWIFGARIVTLVLGDEYQAAGDVLNVLAVCIPLRFLSSSYGAIMSTGDLISRKIIVLGMAAMINISSGLFLAAEYGAVGVALSAVLAEALVLLGMVGFTRASGLLSVRGPSHV